MKTQFFQIALVVFCSTLAAAEQPSGVRLMRPDSLAGWDYGAPPAGWTMAGGRLSGSAKSTPLLSGFSLGDFDLRFQWLAGGEAQWKVLLPEVPRGEGLQLILREGNGCGRMTDGGREIAAGGGVGIASAYPHTAVISRSRGKLSVSVNGRRIAEAAIAPGRRFGLGLAAGGKAEMTDLRLDEPAGQVIFNGKDLAGWWTPAGIGDWKAEGGELVLTPRSGNYLRSEKLYGNFTLSLEYKAQKGCNSGVGIRTPRLGWPSGDGMELQILDTPLSTPLDKHQAMAIYGNVPPLARADRSGQWNRVVVKADGWMISAWVNGELVQQCDTLDHPELKHRNLKGWIGFQDHGGWIRFRDVRVLEAPDGRGLEAWRAPEPKRAAAAMIDRLMNPEDLAVADGIASGTAVARIGGDRTFAPAPAGDAAASAKGRPNPKSEQVVAQLTGPGAIVRISQPRPDGRLAFYFDGEAKPRIECKAADLHAHVPELADESAPILTCLTYKESLKVVLRDARRAEIRLDYVTFPRDYSLASFVDCESGFPRGWVPAVHYRHGQGQWGVHREYDPAPRAASPKQSVPPGATVPVVEIGGTGIVQWVKLQTDKKALDNNDLWLRATVDGEPAVFAPVRFWYPMLAGQGNTDNFVMTDRLGPTVRLAMPYARGVKIEAVNRGTRPVRELSATISYEPATERNRAEIAGRMRLHGIYQPPGETSELVRKEGCGRWVGWIAEQPAAAPPGIESLVVDGEAVAGWSAPNLDLWLGRSGEFRSCLSGRHGNLAWQYLWLAPVEFHKSLVLKTNANRAGGRLALFYMKKQP